MANACRQFHINVEKDVNEPQKPVVRPMYNATYRVSLGKRVLSWSKKPMTTQPMNWDYMSGKTTCPG